MEGGPNKLGYLVRSWERFYRQWNLGVTQDHRALEIRAGPHGSTPARISVRMNCKMFVHNRIALNSDCSQPWKQINLVKVSLKRFWHLEPRDKVSKSNNRQPNAGSWGIVLPDQQMCELWNNTKYDVCHCPAHNGRSKLELGHWGCLLRFEL